MKEVISLLREIQESDQLIERVDLLVKIESMIIKLEEKKDESETPDKG